MNWKDYEVEIHSYFLAMYPDLKITYDAKIIGRYSKRERQVDVLIEGEIAGFPIKLVVDGKYFSKKVNVKCVESFIAMLEDLDAHQGLLITQRGFSEAAINRAHYGPNKIELDILNFDALMEYQNEAALPYAGKNMLLLPAPFGWVVDNTRQDFSIATLYQRGLTLESAQKNLEWMYFNFWKKSEDVSTVSGLIEMQNRSMSAHYTNLELKTLTAPKRDDGREVLVRRAESDELPCVEVTGYIDCGDFICFFVLFTKAELESKNIRKLMHVLKYSIPTKVVFDNTKAIEDLIADLENITAPVNKAQAYMQLAIWSTEIDDTNSAMKYRRLCWDTHNQVYENIAPLISGELALSNIDAALNYSLKTFAMDPTNPRVMQDLIDIYDRPGCDVFFETLVESLKKRYSDQIEALGNITFHNAHYVMGKEDFALAAKEMQIANDLFCSVDSSHYVLVIIKAQIEHLAKLKRKSEYRGQFT